ncbi:MAG TPA: S41 family peptidase, partial [Candidatus Binataceae bacterium]|nr:S41 family peptidase [Candidatus Binataceae bacterium]
TLHREGLPELFTVSVARDEIKINPVSSKDINGFGYIHVKTFQENSDEEVEAALQKFREENHGHVKGLVLDLRDDPGGLLNQAVKISDEFLDGGMIVDTQGRSENQEQKYFSHRKRDFEDFPMVVLVDSGTASASEIVAGALQDQKRAVIVGTQTFGKGSVQTILPLDDHSALRLTTARYFTPNGRSIQAVGITPDIEVEPPKPDLAALEIPGAEVDESPEIHESDLPRHFDNPTAAPSKAGNPVAAPGAGQNSSVTPSKQKGAKGSAKEVEVKDTQLDKAIEILKHWNTFKVQLAKGDIQDSGAVKQ